MSIILILPKMKKYLFIIFFSTLIFSSQSSFSQITLSEIMFNPDNNENYYEFIELFNLSETDSINLANWKISDGSDDDQIIDAGKGIIVAPHQFAVILDPGYFENERIYDAIIPPEALILTIDGSTFGSGGLSNSTPEKVTLIDMNGDTVSTYIYTIDNPEGYSDEKINLAGPNTPNNWSNSRQLHGTPGAENSVTPKLFDVSLKLSFDPPLPKSNSDVTISGIVKNKGIKPTTELTLHFFVDENRDSIPEIKEQLGAPIVITEPIFSNDSSFTSIIWENVPGGAHSIIGVIEFGLDQDTFDNQNIKILAVSFDQMSVVINEIMYRPVSGGAEWIELYNPTDKSVDPYQWKFSDSHTSIKTTITDQHLILNSGDFVILAENQNIFNQFLVIPCTTFIFNNKFPTLNNDEDSIILYDLTETVVDQVNYHSTWGNEYGVSLERKKPLGDSNDPKNWTSSKHIVGGTPGKKNSVSPLDFDLAINPADVRFSPPNPRLGSTVNIHVKVKNVGLNPISNFEVGFYFDAYYDSLIQAHEIIDKFIAENDTLIADDSLSISQDFSNFVQGINQILVQIAFPQDQNDDNNIAICQFIVPFSTKQIVINEVMFNPTSPRPEWIELYNTSNSPVDLKNWKLSDYNFDEKMEITSHSLIIEPDNYVILTKNENITEFYAPITAPVIKVTPWQTLNNDSDAVVIYDLTDTTIDSMFYLGKWNRKRDVSLERIDYLWNSIDSSSWASSNNLIGATPGSYNSVSPNAYDLALKEIHFDIETPHPGETVSITAIVENEGRNSIEGFSVNFFDDTNNDSILASSEKITNTIFYSEWLQRYDAVTISLEWTELPSGVHYIHAVISSDVDLNAENNSKMTRLDVGFQSQSLVINEIMFSPFPGQPEWIELYNRSYSAINFQDWGISDSDTATILTPCSNPFYIEPDSFLVISSDMLDTEIFPEPPTALVIDRKFPTLNSDVDRIYLYDLNKNVIDVVQYHASWGGGNGISLERINPHIPAADSNNWNSCVYTEGGTPGKKNSIFIQKVPASTAIIVSPNPFSPDADGFEDVTIISYQLPMKTSTVNLKIYDLHGRLMRYLSNNRLSGAENSVIWDGTADDGNLCRIGIYIIYLEALNAAEGVITSHKKIVVLAAKL